MIALIENNILARLEAAGTANVLGYKFGTMQAYPEDWDEHLVSAEVTFPSAYAKFVSFDADSQLRSGARVKATFGLVVAAKSQRNKTAARQGFMPSNPDAPAEPGSMQLMEDAIGLLQRQQLGLDIAPFELLAGQAPELSDKLIKAGVSVMAMQWQTSFIFQLALPIPGVDGRALGDFATFDTQWDVPPFDGVTDLETTVTLPQET